MSTTIATDKPAFDPYAPKTVVRRRRGGDEGRMVCPAHGTLGCHQQQPDGTTRCSFAQSKPDGSVLVDGDNRSRKLVYRAPDGEIFAVPNVRYNQPIAWQTESTRWYAAQCRERAAVLRSHGDKLMRMTADEMEAQATKLDSMASEMEDSAAQSKPIED